MVVSARRVSEVTGIEYAGIGSFMRCLVRSEQS